MVIVQMKNFKKIPIPVLDYEIFYSQNRPILIAMSAVQNLKCGAMRIKRHVPTVERNGNAPTKMQLVYHTVNTPINAEQ
jgi:hypothetical protein